VDVSSTGAGVAAGVVGVVPDHLLRVPRAAAVGGALEEEINVAGVTTAGFAALGEGEEVAVLGADDRGNAVGVIAVAAGDVDVRFFDGGCGGQERNYGDEGQQRGEQGTGEHGIWGWVI